MTSSATKLAAIVRTLRETSSIAGDAVLGLMERGSLLHRLERTSASLEADGAEFSERARRLEARRRCTVGCVILAALAACFLILLFASYLTQR